MASSDTGISETEPLLLYGHGHGPTSTSVTIPEAEGEQVQPPFKLFCFLLVDSIPGLSFLRIWTRS
jgi:hypothetical protein